MITEFEKRLADVLGARLPTPFKGRVDVPPGPSASNNPRLLVAAVDAEPVEPDLGNRRPEIVPGAPDPRTVSRLRCTVNIQVLPGQNSGRPQALQGLDACLFTLQAADLQNGSALGGGAADPGFLIQSLRVARASAPVQPSNEQGQVTLSLLADGWFWPVGATGQAGRQIGEIRIRNVALPIEVNIPAPLTASGSSVELTVTVGSASTQRLTDSPAPLPLNFGRLALSVFAPGGKPGKGTLSGGTAGSDGSRLVDLADGQAKVTYKPPAESTADELVVGMENGEEGLGVELGRALLIVRGS